MYTQKFGYLSMFKLKIPHIIRRIKFMIHSIKHINICFQHYKKNSRVFCCARWNVFTSLQFLFPKFNIFKWNSMFFFFGYKLSKRSKQGCNNCFQSFFFPLYLWHTRILIAKVMMILWLEENIYRKYILKLISNWS